MEYIKVAIAILASVGVGGGLVIALASYLGKIWANRILEADRARYAKEVEDFKRSAAISLKEYEIKTTAIQADFNRMALKLAPALAELYNACFLGVELGVLHAPYAKSDPAFYRVLVNKFIAAGDGLHTELTAAKLLLPSSIYNRARDFEKRIHDLRKETHVLLGTDTYTYVLKPDATAPTSEAGAALLQKVKENEVLLEEILEELRRKMGTAV